MNRRLLPLTVLLGAGPSATVDGYTPDLTAMLLFLNRTGFNGLFRLNRRGGFNVPVGAFFPQAQGKRFGSLIESLGDAPAQIVVERAMYWNADGVTWAAGTNALATKVQ